MSVKVNKKDKSRLYGMYNATSTEEIAGSDELESYENWLERQLLNRLDAYDSTSDTLRHIKRVSELLTGTAVVELIRRANVHDSSKLESPEKELFDEMTPKLAKSTYGSDKYKGFLSELKVALDHHYKENSHHPEHYPYGVNDFDLFDLIEMFFDWKAATERHNDGNIYKSIEINKKRFNLTTQLEHILINTAVRLDYKK